MRIFHTLDQVRGEIRKPVVTVGSYDGVHAGHRVILAQLRLMAERTGGESVVVTFNPHPRKVIDSAHDEICLLNSLEEKICLLESVGIDNLFIVDFTPQFRALSSYDFARNYLFEGIGTKTLIIGYNHHFGRNREGDRDYLEQLKPDYDFDLFQMSKHDVNNAKVSSTVIRTVIERGDLATAHEYLTEPYLLIAGMGEKGELIYGEPDKLFPPCGKYEVTVTDGTLLSDGVLDIFPDRLFLNTHAGIDRDKRLIIRFKDTDRSRR